MLAKMITSALTSTLTSPLTSGLTSTLGSPLPERHKSSPIWRENKSGNTASTSSTLLTQRKSTRPTENKDDMELKLWFWKKYKGNRNSFFSDYWRWFIKWFEQSLTFKIDQVTMSGVVEVSEKTDSSAVDLHCKKHKPKKCDRLKSWKS